jgi:4a-hydroxytetrahydrobiopterin dehydratase
MWREEDRKLSRTFNFQDFTNAFAFTSKVALLAAKNSHYPQIIFERKKVTIKLSTDNVGGLVTQKDHNMAEAIDDAYSASGIVLRHTHAA